VEIGQGEPRLYPIWIEFDHLIQFGFGPLHILVPQMGETEKIMTPKGFRIIFKVGLNHVGKEKCIEGGGCQDDHERDEDVPDPPEDDFRLVMNIK
jgi:hypothetical protein